MIAHIGQTVTYAGSTLSIIVL